ncbi:hypothetical protein [Mycobacterium sp. URHB0021]|jgi:hypothetical protein
MTELATSYRRDDEAGDQAPSTSTVKPTDTSTLITEQQVLMASAAAIGVAPVKTHRAIDALHALAGAVRLVFLGSDKPPAQRHYLKRHAYLENALMSREMDRL